MPSTDPVSSISNCYRLIVSYKQFGQVVAALFATELFHVHFCAKSSGIQGRVKFEISTHFSVPKWKK